MPDQENLSNLFNPIQTITIENFQSHEKTILAPAGPGQLTVIVGQSRQGKTAIFRALRWLFYNAPDGDDFIRWGTNFARVTAEYADGTQVIRYRTKGGINRYIVQKPGQLEQIFEGFGRGAVPLEVQQVTGVSPVEIGEGLSFNLNLAEQLDGPFLGNKSLSSTGRAKVLGKLAGTEEVDQAAKTLGTDLFRWRRDKDLHEKGISELQEQLKGYGYLTEFKENMDKLAVIKDAVRTAMERKERLEKLNQDSTTVENQIDEISARISCLDRFVCITELLLIRLEKNIGILQSLLTVRQEWMQNEAARLNVIQVLLSTKDLSEAENIIQSTGGQLERQRQSIKLFSQFAEMVNKSNNIDCVLIETKDISLAEYLSAKASINLDRIRDFSRLADGWNKINADMVVIDHRIERTEKISDARELIDKAEDSIRRKVSLKNCCDFLIKANLDISGWDNKITMTDQEIKGMQAYYFDILKQAGKCPMCGSNVNEENKERIIGEVI